LVAAAALHVRGAHAAVSLTKTASVATVSAGDVASFHYLVQNGSGTAFTVILTDTLPAGVTWTENSASCTVTSGRQLACNFGTLTAGASRTFNASGTTDEADCAASPLSSTATVQSSSTTGDQSTAEIHVVCPDVSYTAMIDTVEPGQQLAISVGIRNQGAGTARNVHVTMLHLTTNLGWSLAPPDAACSVGAESTTCAIGDLLPGEGHSFRVAATGPTDVLCGHEGSPFMQFTVDNQSSCCPGKSTGNTVRLPGDQDASCKVDVADVFYLINFLFAGGPDPQ
jgi:uncharacterized repeat protein (TIGR01451 family)